ncbi:hypothetical protein RCL1_007425 [Eukaryota sp. TZLM3-RCL]
MLQCIEFVFCNVEIDTNIPANYVKSFTAIECSFPNLSYFSSMSRLEELTLFPISMDVNSLILPRNVKFLTTSVPFYCVDNVLPLDFISKLIRLSVNVSVVSHDEGACLEWKLSVLKQNPFAKIKLIVE